MYKTIDISGKTFGRLTAIEPTSKRGREGAIVWLCQCACGNSHEADSNRLQSGNTKSCGCSRRALVCKNGHDTSSSASRNKNRGCILCEQSRFKTETYKDKKRNYRKTSKGSSVDRAVSKKYYYSEKGAECNWRKYKTRLKQRILSQENQIYLLEQSLERISNAKEE